MTEEIEGQIYGATPGPMRPSARWTSDCNGKQDYDCEIVSLSTLYWPRGGGYMVLDTADGRGLRDSANGRPPSAHASIVLHFASVHDEEEGDFVQLVDSQFEAETEAEVKAQVEAWAAVQYGRIAKALPGILAPIGARGESGTGGTVRRVRLLLAAWAVQAAALSIGASAGSMSRRTAESGMLLIAAAYLFYGLLASSRGKG